MSSKVRNSWKGPISCVKQNQDPYGRGGWAQMASEEEQRAQKEETMPDLGLPAKREKIQPVRYQLVSSDIFNQSNWSNLYQTECKI